MGTDFDDLPPGAFAENEPDFPARRNLMMLAGLLGLVPAAAPAQPNAMVVSRGALEKLGDYWVTPQDFGAKGDGVTDDAPAYAAMFSTGRPVYIPYTAKGYFVGSTVTVTSDVVCNGFLIPGIGIGRTDIDQNRFAVIVSPGDYNTKRSIVGLRVQGSLELRSAGVNGIRCDAPNTRLERCQAFRLDHGIVIRNYSILVEQCAAWQCNTNLSAYARSFKEEINALAIVGGNYDSAVNCAINIGDVSWSDALAASKNHGVMVSILDGVNVDGSHMRIDSVIGVSIKSFYVENSGGSDCGIRLGGSGDGHLRNVRIENSFFKNVRYAIKCESAVNGLDVGRNFYTQVYSCALYLQSDLYHFSYAAGDAIASFTQGTEVHTAFRALPLPSITWSNVSLERQGLRRGIQNVVVDPGVWYPGGELRDAAPTVKICNAGVSGRFYTKPKTDVSGTVNGVVFKFSMPSDCYFFNGGDRIVTNPPGTTYVRSVDYAAGTLVLGGGNVAANHATISQVAATWHSTTVTYSGAPPTAGTWARGDYCRNGMPAAGAPKGWLCTAAGTPGTWVSEGSL